MSSRKERERFVQRVRQVTEQLREQGPEWFQSLVPIDRVDEWLDELGCAFRDSIYTPVVTLWMFAIQTLSSDHSCREAVARLLAWRTSCGQQPCSPQTGAYCTARSRLPEELFTKLVRATGEQLEQQRQEAWTWKGRTVKIVDGTTVTMPDTFENQTAYPQSRTQKAGLGFPIARLVVLFSLATGAVLESALGPYRGKKTGENQLFRGLMHRLDAGDVVLADRYYASYWDLALLRQRDVDLVSRLHQMRHADFRRGAHLGKTDHRVAWEKPPRPSWMDEAIYAALPETLEVREVRVRLAIPGFRVQEYVLVTTLLDVEKFSAEDLATVYRGRWHAELDLRSLKSVMQMEPLRCKTPEMVRKELAMHLVAYNLIRRLMAEAARHHDLLPRQISFSGALQTFQALHDRGICSAPHTPERLAILLVAIAWHRVGNRPNRCEPRAVKRRSLPHRLLTEPRHLARTKLLKCA